MRLDTELSRRQGLAAFSFHSFWKIDSRSRCTQTDKTSLNFLFFRQICKGDMQVLFSFLSELLYLFGLLLRDDMHLWLAPFTAGGKHTITVTFVDSLRIAMIRIWVSYGLNFYCVTQIYWPGCHHVYQHQQAICQLPRASVSKRVLVQTFDMKMSLICMKMNLQVKLIFM